MPESFAQKEKIETRAQSLLKSLEQRKLIENSSEVAVVVAHQDDESIGFGLTTSLSPDCLMVHATDGAPADKKYWAKGAQTREQYAHIRERELDIALKSTSHRGEKVSLGSTDLEAILHLTENAERLAEIFSEKGIKIVMTHSYEGGHPDHDAVAFSVHAAKEILKKQNIDISIVEAPLYRMDGKQFVAQKFIPDNTVRTVKIPLSNMEMVSRVKSLDLHRSQAGVFEELSDMGMLTENEWLRQAPEYNFTKLPNSGNLSKMFSSDLREKWSALTQKAIKHLELRGKF